MTALEPSVSNSTLYDQDFYLWLKTTATHLKEGKFAAIDLDNLIEEIESMGRSEKRALQSNLKILLMHLLKYKYQPDKRSNSWLATIFEHRDRIKELLKDSPSLNNYISEVFKECYQHSCQKAVFETELPLDTFPLECPFTLTESLDTEFLPQ